MLSLFPLTRVYLQPPFSMPHAKLRGLLSSTISHSQDRIRTCDIKWRARIQALPARDQDLVNDMMAHDGQFMDCDVPFSEGPPCAPSVDLSCEDEIDWEILTEMASQMAKHNGYKRVDDRVRTDRMEAQTKHWALQMDCLVATYLEYRAKEAGDGIPSGQPDVLPGDCENCQILDIGLVDVFTYKCGSFPLSSSQEFPNEWLISHGYLGCSPLHPTVAVSIQTLAVFQQYHHSCPGFSIQAQCKALCHLHGVPYRPYLSAQFSAVFDVYLEILAQVEQRMNAVLRRNTPHWRMRNTCPACFYKLKDEPPLKFSYLASINGNNSLKRWILQNPQDVSHVNLQEPHSDYWISRHNVDRFKDEVKPGSRSCKDNWEDMEDPDSSMMHCVECWRNAGSEEQKRMFKVFDESGIFIACCRHRFMLVVCDIVQSGELAKYPLAVVDCLLTVYGSDGGLAYDIGCAFATTLTNSVLGPHAHALNLTLMVGTFHGHAHNLSMPTKMASDVYSWNWTH
ncbi:hypothetical protein JVU11DRAFT_5911 [Chiua virens]|nr:hypothetical protein JVU11DRAFT_5911 [Chiua virens]